MAAADRTRVLAYVVSAVPGAAIAAAHGAGLLSERVALLLFVPSFVALNAMHMAGTWTRTYLDPAFARAAPLERIVVPALVALLALSLESVGLAVVLFGVQYYASVHHGMMQHYGIVRDGQRRRGRTLSRAALVVDQAACVLPLLAAIAFRATRIGSYEQAPLAAPPLALVILLAAGGAVAVVLLLVRELRAHLRGDAVDPVGLLLVLVVHGVWIAGVIVLRHPAIPLFAMASAHYIEHLFFVRTFERGRAQALAALPPRVRQLVAPTRLVGYYAFLAVLGACGIVLVTLLAVALRGVATGLHLRPADAFPLPPWGAAMIAVNFHHYVLEHRIWRAPRGVPSMVPAAA